MQWLALALVAAAGCGESAAPKAESAAGAGAGGGNSGTSSASGAGSGPAAGTGAGLGGSSGASGNGGSVSGSSSGAGSDTGGSSGAGGSAGAGGVSGAAGGPSLEGSGKITYERWNDIPGEAVSLVPVNETPDVTMQLDRFQAPDDVGQDFSARMRGILTAPATGEYTFWVSSDDNSELNLSTDETPANKVRIAHVTGSPAWTGYVEWTKFPTQKSAPVSLVAGKRYYVEALLKEDITEDHLAVGWLKPGEVGSVPSEIIPGKQLSPIDP